MKTIFQLERVKQPHGLAPPRRQQGVVLIIALIVLVAMTLAGLAMVRSVDTSTMIAGNMAFKQSASLSGETGVETAINWLSTSTNLENDSGSNGYYATSQDCLDLTGSGHVPDSCTPPYTVLDWTSAGKVKILPVDTNTGNQVAYVIHRLCDSSGALNAATCSTEQSSMGGSSKGGSRQMTTYQPGAWNTVANRGYYRITVRVAGPSKNYSFVQAIVSQ